MVGNQKNFGRKAIKSKIACFHADDETDEAKWVTQQPETFTKSKILDGKIWPFFIEQMPKAGS